MYEAGPGPQVAQQGPRSAMERIESLEKNVADHERRFGEIFERLSQDVHHLAHVLGVSLPSESPQPANILGSGPAGYPGLR